MYFKRDHWLAGDGGVAMDTGDVWSMYNFIYETQPGVKMISYNDEFTHTGNLVKRI